MRSEEEVEAFLEREVVPAIRRFEEEREAHARRLRASLPDLRLVAAGAGGGLLVSAWLGSWLPVQLALAVPAGLWISRLPRIGLAPRSPRRDLLKRLVAFWDPGFTYGGQPISADEIRRSRLLPEVHDGKSLALPSRGASSMRFEDGIAGKLGATAFRLCEVRVVERKEKSTRDVWKGLFFAADFNKEFHGWTLVRTDRAERRLGSLGRAFQAGILGSGGQLVELEDPAFERHFVVHGSDPVESRYILSPSLMRRIVRFRENTGSELRMAFLGGHVYMALPLEEDLFSGEVTVARVRLWLGELLFAVGIVEELDLNTRIWSKA